MSTVQVPARGDLIEVTLRAEVAAISPINEPGSTHIVYLTHPRGEAPALPAHVPPIYLGPGSAVLLLQVIKRGKGNLDLDALPEGAVVEASNRDLPSLSFIYRKGGTGPGIADTAWRRDYPWASMEGGNFSAADLWNQHDELVELVRKESA